MYLHIYVHACIYIRKYVYSHTMSTLWATTALLRVLWATAALPQHTQLWASAVLPQHTQMRATAALPQHIYALLCTLSCVGLPQLFCVCSLVYSDSSVLQHTAVCCSIQQCVAAYSLVHLECHFFIVEYQSILLFSTFLSLRSVEKRPRRLQIGD